MVESIAGDAYNDERVEVFGMGYGLTLLAVAVCLIGTIVALACLRHSVQSVRYRPVWLAAGAASIGGAGMWMGQELALLGLRIDGVGARADAGLTFASLALSIASCLLAFLIIGRVFYWPRFVAGGLVLGVGMAWAMELSMQGVVIPGEIVLSGPVSIVAGLVTLLLAFGLLAGFQLVPTLRMRLPLYIAVFAGIVGVFFISLEGMHFELDDAAPIPDEPLLFDVVFPLFVLGALALTIPITAALVVPDRRNITALADRAPSERSSADDSTEERVPQNA